MRPGKVAGKKVANSINKSEHRDLIYFFVSLILTFFCLYSAYAAYQHGLNTTQIIGIIILLLFALLFGMGAYVFGKLLLIKNRMK